MNQFTVLIPLRLNSKRLKGKPLLKIDDKPLFVKIFENIKNCVDSVYIATYDQKIIDECIKRKIPFIETSSKPRNGSERIAEAVTKKGIKSPIIINLQGDVIDADYNLISGVVSTLLNYNADVSTAVSPLKNQERKEKDIVKVVLNKDHKCIYFTRASIPFMRYKSKLIPRVYKHIGVYCFKREVLLRYADLMPTYLEECEALEQMRLIENGIDIYGYITNREYRKIDNIKDLQQIRGKK